MTNFDFLLSAPDFAPFGEVAVAAEKIYSIDPAACVLNCRRAMEFAVKWMYSVDSALSMPWDDKLISLMSTEEFRDIVDADLMRRMDYIRKTGNCAAHDGRRITKEQAMLCLQNLWVFLDFVAYCYGSEYESSAFDPTLAEQLAVPVAVVPPETEIQLAKLIEENAALRQQLTARREEQQETYTPKPLDISEYKTRKLYIDVMLEDAGWIHGKNWIDEVELQGMPNKSGTGYADYVLYGDDGKALAVIEAKRTCVDVAKGRQQAKLYADLLEKQYGRRPVIFLTNGFEVRIEDGQYPERMVATIYSKRDLEKLFNLRKMRLPLNMVQVDKNIAGRYYQEEAIKAVCESFDKKNRRKALLVMATGSGKTRTIIALCKVLMERGWVRDILFLADRNSLVTQAKRNFVNLMPELSVVDLCEDKTNYGAHCVFSTYQTMFNCIDSVHDENDDRLFTCGHFDLVICDEAHRSIYNKYQDIFNYFDAPLVGLTATPKKDVDRNTYEVFDLEEGIPTYGYELGQAVQDGFLVDFVSVETTLKFIHWGIIYDDLTPEEKEEYERTFGNENGELPESISSSALNEWIFNEDTIREVLRILMKEGLKIDYGNKIGKTIIFAKNHRHAEEILENFGKEFPHLTGWAKVIDNYMTYAQSAIDEFSEPEKLPQIDISVDMLDTGFDVPEVLNLVFFKKVMSKAKFWQMIGRGTRLCPGLIDGKDKDKFYIFDFCGNFEFFRMNKGKAAQNTVALSAALFNLKAQIVYKLQDMDYQTEELTAFRKDLVQEMAAQVQALDRENFAVKQHLRYVERYSDPENYQALTYENTLEMAEELAPLIQPEADDAKALRFDALMYGIELAYLVGKKYDRARKDLVNKVQALSGLGSIPEIKAQQELIQKILKTSYLENAGINEFENIRNQLRDLIKYIPVGRTTYTTNFDDEVLSMEFHESQLDYDYLDDYKKKAEFYVRQHQENAAIAKLKGNIPLKEEDIAELERILWSEVGTKQDYEREIGSIPLGEFVRSVTGLDMAAAKEAFAEYLNSTQLDSRQIYFVNQIVEYIVQNGMLKDYSVMQHAPFTDQGSIVEIFTDLKVWEGIRKAIERVNDNARVA